MSRVAICRLYLLGLGVFTLFWWPLSHWFYRGWYHRLLGFESYDYALVKVIGTIGVVPVLGMFFTAAEPLRNRDFIIVLLVFCVLMALTYVYLIRGHGFPQREYLYAALLAGNSIPLTVLYPWRATASALRSR
jgi:hypothetical protein